MKREKQSKLIVILALCVSVVGLAIGFAAFSNTLTISSSATVSPDESDFKIKAYGLVDTYPSINVNNIELYSSDKISEPILYDIGVLVMIIYLVLLLRQLVIMDHIYI